MIFDLTLLPMTVGSLPHRRVGDSWNLILSQTPEIPAWPQLPQRAFLENMYVQYSERFPGVMVDSQEERLWVDRARDLSPELERLYTAYLDHDLFYGAISAEYAEGLVTLPVDGLAKARAVKGHVTGPVSWGLVVTDQDRRPILYDDTLADAVARHLCLKATWQELRLRQYNPNTIFFLDEPYMSSYGSAYVALGRGQVVSLLEEVLSGIEGLKGVHCCGNTDWSILLETSIDILSLDAYEYAPNLALYPEEVAAFVDRGGVIAWGIVPNSPRVRDETVDSLVERLLAGMDLLVRKGIDLDLLLQAALITPACGLGTLTVAGAERALELLNGVAAEMQARYL